jgi:radical SAM superfamily enzyme YgiQ (UPF0313 family)
MLFNKQGWRGKSAKRLLDEIEYITKNYPHVKIIDPIDDNFFVSRKRIEEFCKGLIERKINVNWRADCRFDYFSNYTAEFIKLMEKSGCVELDFGGETGSERLLKLIDKDVTPQQMLNAVENLKKWAPAIKPYASWMSGLPTETDEDLNETFNLMDEMTEVNPHTQHMGIFVFTPFPSPFTTQLDQQDIFPHSLEEWSKINMFQFTPPWHSKKYVRKLHAISAVTRYALYSEDRINERSMLFKIGFRMLNKMAKTRWRKRNFNYPIEMQLTNALARKSRGWI